MRDLLSTISIILLTIGIANAQDILFKTDGQEIQVKVIEVSKADVKYKLTSNLDGPNYVLPKSDVFMVEYANGSKEVFAKENKTNRGSVLETNKKEMTELERLYHRRRITGIPVTAIGSVGVVVAAGVLIDGLINLGNGGTQAKSQSFTAGAFCVVSLVALGVGVDNLTKANIIKRRLDNGEVHIQPRILDDHSFQAAEIHRHTGFGFQMTYTF